jgi:hypothetical protein
MKTDVTSPEVYRLHVWIRRISPMIWRRLLVRSDSTIADLHYTLQIAFGWSDEHLNLFHIHGQDYGVYHDGGINFSTDPNLVRLCNFKFRKNERFLYEYDFGYCWRHEVRVEERLAQEDKRLYPYCIGGQRRAPLEDCGGPLAFMVRRDEIPLQVDDLLEEFREDLETNDLEAIRDLAEDIEELHEWLILDSFDRRTVNRRLKQYATNDENWMWR